MLHIAIDGPAGAGKSTIAKAISKELGIPYLDTGAMYRTLAFYALQNGVDPSDEAAVSQLLPNAVIDVEYIDREQFVLLNGKDVSAYIRTPEVSKGASDIGVHACVRKKLVETQQQVAAKGPIVMDGRDIGSVVMPDAPHKFFVTASPRIRAERRLQEMRDKGATPLPTLDELELQIQQRDNTDSTRKVTPLRQVEDATLIDTSEMSIAGSIAAVLNIVRAKGLDS